MSVESNQGLAQIGALGLSRAGFELASIFAAVVGMHSPASNQKSCLISVLLWRVTEKGFVWTRVPSIWWTNAVSASSHMIGVRRSPSWLEGYITICYETAPSVAGWVDSPMACSPTREYPNNHQTECPHAGDFAARPLPDSAQFASVGGFFGTR